MATERVKNSIYNSVTNVIVNFGTILLSFIVRTFFIKYLGEQLLGLDGLYTNILSLLSLTELGFSSAISFSLYKPLAYKDYKKVSSLMVYIKKIYQKIGIIILLLGLMVMPFLGYMVKDYTVNYSIYWIYFLYLINTVSTYYISYAAILLEADQKNYKITSMRIIFDLITYGLQMVSLIVFKNFVLYLLIQFIFRNLQRLVLYIYIKKQYREVNFKEAKELDKKDKDTIKKNIKGLSMHRVGDYLVNSTDNIIISSIINISTAGLYANYLSVTYILKSLINTTINATTASLGNLNAKQGEESQLEAFKIINLVNYFLSGIVVVSLYLCFNNFISIWIGKKYVLSTACVIVICSNFYLSTIMATVNSIKNSSGLYYVDRFVPVLNAILNLIISIILGYQLGLLGVLLGTSISTILSTNSIKPYMIYKYIFKKSSKEYYFNLLKNIIHVVLSIVLVSLILKKILFKYIIVDLLVTFLIGCLIYILSFILINIRNPQLIYLGNILKNMLKRK